MTETSTKAISPSTDENFERLTIDELSATEQEFYYTIQPALHAMMKNPSGQVVDRILNFSKEF